MPDDNRLAQPKLRDYKGDVVKQLLHRITVRKARRMRRRACKAVARLVGGAVPHAGKVPAEPLPVARVGAEAVEQQARGLQLGDSFRFPFQVMEADSVSVEPAVDR